MKTTASTIYELSSRRSQERWQKKKIVARERTNDDYVCIRRIKTSLFASLWLAHQMHFAKQSAWINKLALEKQMKMYRVLW